MSEFESTLFGPYDLDDMSHEVVHGASIDPEDFLPEHVDAVIMDIDEYSGDYDA